MLENSDKIMHLRFDFHACPVNSPFGFVHLMHRNLSTRELFCQNSLMKVNTLLLIYNHINIFLKQNTSLIILCNVSLLSLRPTWIATSHSMGFRLSGGIRVQSLEVSNHSERRSGNCPFWTMFTSPTGLWDTLRQLICCARLLCSLSATPVRVPRCDWIELSVPVE